ncbi:mRNA cap guanine-N7 methyltransferase-like [Homalodisca vitripennis]|uniref:mRNA cap guanine-N7 methyltransferase-like n=1 Tax=Homalodisca vitripennis TaxID=197043 RepID=UPI001EEB40E0|nr:mRNA cap guanine-N7 methyltransferase-like [Homalodisca vitripennis]XP_046675256.1 mRNA cap guanine-N7 methyltransferase-like [Homalodisca vitripennis]XP_046675257.1 mRNA cap guanine-N7 methyltransferase-like [Homalodisca vitripennis]XP_046675258.1 mRNA cap guanine-N7 methyltransferase-like [Homalodisca vitripennis]
MEALKTEEGTVQEKNTTSEPPNGDVKSSDQLNESHSAVVAAHYNSLEEKGLTERSKSRIVHLRNFNNWIKSMLINEYMALIKEGRSVGRPIHVLDMCCGKGGDLLKWRSADIGHLICADIAGTSVDQCKSRYEDMRQRQRRERHYHQGFTAEFIVADCTKVRLRERYKDVTLQLDLVSCQFSFHYCFESLPQAECMLRNAAECLRPGGYFIGTMPDANDIVARYRAAGSPSFGNPVYKIELEKEDQPFPLFGAKYGFTLVDVVNCPEFLVHLPTLERLARKYGLELVSKSKFEEYYEKNKEKGRGLLGKMQAFESYPPFEGNSLNGEEDEYTHAKDFMEKNKCDRIGTLSKPEWEAASLYMVFAFRKMKPITMDREGRPVYEQQNADQPSDKKETPHKRSAEVVHSTEDPSPKKLEGDSTT